MDTKSNTLGYATSDFPKIGEKLHILHHKSGLKAFIVPKPGYSRRYAALAVNFGSTNASFKSGDNGSLINVPDGTAHFLEHKLFEQETGNIMEDFARLGASPNAYTGFANTVYLFSCTANLTENLRLLLDFVQKPQFTAEGVEKEKGIISQEILMKLDDPDWVVFFNLMKVLYPGHPVSRDIGGTQESIGRMDSDILRKCYDTFYRPSNMVLLIVGDCSPDEVFKTVAAVMDGLDSVTVKADIMRVDGEYRRMSEKRAVEKEMQVSSPMFRLGFRDSMPEMDLNAKERLQREVTLRILLDYLVGKSSKLFNQLYAEGLVNGPIDFEYNAERTFAFSVLGGESQEPYRFKEQVEDEVSRIRESGLDEMVFLRLCDSWYGRLVRTFNSVERTAHSFISSYFKGVTLFDYFDVYDKITLKYAEGIFREHFGLNSMALSIVRPYGSGSV